MRLFLPVVLVGALVLTSPLGGRDCNENGSDDRVDVSNGTSPDCNGNLIPADHRQLYRWELGGVTVGDFNGDGQPDVALRSAISGSISVLIGSGARFEPPRTVALENGAADLDAADFDGDGDLDLVVAREFELVVLSNDGLANFTRALGVPAGQNPIAVATGDFDLDGTPDAATANSLEENGFAVSSVSLFLNNGSGDFLPGVNAVVSSGARAIEADDLDGDGDLDLIAASRDSEALSVLTNLGGGAFSEAAIHLIGAAPTALASSKPLRGSSAAKDPVRISMGSRSEIWTETATSTL